MTKNNAVNATQSGFQSLTSGGVWNGRTLQQGTGISISNADGIAGNPTITNTAGGTGSIVQQVRTSSTTSANTSKTLAATGTTPTTSNTDSLITLAITPTNSNNILKFVFTAPFSLLTSENASFCLFSGTTFVTGFPQYPSGSSSTNTTMYFKYYMVAGGTSPVTFDVRWGSSSGLSLRSLQNSSGTAYYNSAVTATQFIITEVKP